MTVFAACRLRPVLPAFVVKNIRVEIVQVLEAQERAILVAALMVMKKAKAGPQSMRIDKGDHRVEIIEPVLQRRARQDESEARGQSLDDPAGLPSRAPTGRANGPSSVPSWRALLARREPARPAPPPRSRGSRPAGNRETKVGLLFEQDREEPADVLARLRARAARHAALP
jgi:hypothetical protein